MASASTSTSPWPLMILSLLLFSTPSSSSTPSHTQSQPSSSSSPPFSKIYAFGDSFTDTGNTISTTGPSGFNYVSSLPYGMTYFHHPTNRYSDGRLIIDFVAQYLSLPLLPPYKAAQRGGPHGVNFAVAGATAIEHQFFVKNNLSFDITPQSIGSELGWFNKVLEAQGCVGSDRVKCGAVLEDALVWVGEIGANDYAYSAVSTVSKSVVQSLAMRRISTFLEAILAKGAKYVVVQGLPPTGCLTLAMYLSPPDDRDELGCVRSADQQSSAHNALLQSKIQDLRKGYPGSVIVYADYYNAYRNIIKNPAKYGLKEPFKACCGSGTGAYNYDFFSACGSPSSKACSDPDHYINWDGVHLTDAMNKAVSELLLQGGYSQPSFQYLISKRKSQG